MNFNKNQLKAINHINGNMVINAVAGSGKTSTLSNRIVNMIENHGIAPQNILAITFSKKAKENMSNKLSQLLSCSGAVNVETFHSLALKIIQVAYGNAYSIWSTQWKKEECINKICENLALCSKEKVPYNEIMIFITKQKVNMLNPNDNLIPLDKMPFTLDKMKQIYLDYENYKKRNKLIEFDDFLNIACDIFKENKSLLSLYQDKFKYILSDEYQDVSLNQGLLIEYLGKKNNNTFIVGDVLQSIYSFRGGVSKYMLDFDKTWKDVSVINLNINYRCSADIIDVANKFAKSIPESSHRNYSPTVAYKGYFKKPIFTRYDDSFSESTDVVNNVVKLCVDKYKYGDIAILARTNAQLQKLESTLHTKGIPFDVVDGRLFTDLPEIQLLLSYIKLSVNTNDDEAFRYLYNKPMRWLGKKFLQEVEIKAKMSNKSLYNTMFLINRRDWRFKGGINEIQKTIERLQKMKFKNISEMIRFLRGELPIDDFVSKGNIGDDGLSEQMENMDSFQDTCKEFKTVNELLLYLEDLNKAMSKVDSNQKVKLLTIHKSKGLEFPVVFVVGCSDGLLPHYKTNDVDDEKRLMYVAITRAEQELYLSSAKYYNDKTLKPSPFIKTMGNTIIKEKANTNNTY